MRTFLLCIMQQASGNKKSLFCTELNGNHQFAVIVINVFLRDEKKCYHRKLQNKKGASKQIQYRTAKPRGEKTGSFAKTPTPKFQSTLQERDAALSRLHARTHTQTSPPPPPALCRCRSTQQAVLAGSLPGVAARSWQDSIPRRRLGSETSEHSGLASLRAAVPLTQ